MGIKLAIEEVRTGLQVYRVLNRKCGKNGFLHFPAIQKNWRDFLNFSEHYHLVSLILQTLMFETDKWTVEKSERKCLRSFPKTTNSRNRKMKHWKFWTLLYFGHRLLNHVKFLTTNVICKLYVIVIFKKSESSFNLKRILITKQLTGGASPHPLSRGWPPGQTRRKNLIDVIWERSLISIIDLYVLQTVICILYSTWSYVAKRITKGG